MNFYIKGGPQLNNSSKQLNLSFGVVHIINKILFGSFTENNVVLIDSLIPLYFAEIASPEEWHWLPFLEHTLFIHVILVCRSISTL
jgi:hypothetical protein